jgi:Spy/CpxP family protein refolding chaperone
MHTLRRALPLLLAAGAPLAFAQHAHQGSPYAGLQEREIKALSKDDTQRLLQGQGMSLALAAELNGYPGPLHVLELADGLQLTPAQRAQTQALMDGHKTQARELGRQLVEAERALDQSFAQGHATSEEVGRHTRAIGSLQAALRDAHLQTHLKQAALLTREQIAAYQRLRGYTSAQAQPQHHPHQGAHQ